MPIIGKPINQANSARFILHSLHCDSLAIRDFLSEKTRAQLSAGDPSISIINFELNRGILLWRIYRQAETIGGEEKSCSDSLQEGNKSMWTTMALALALQTAPGQTAELRLTNIRPTVGYMGSARADSKVLPGDVFFVTFDIDNLLVDDDGIMHYNMFMEVKDSKGGVKFRGEPEDKETPAVLGGHGFAAFAHVELEQDMPPGEYTITVTVSDRLAKTKNPKTLQQKFEVLPRGFGLVRLTISYDQPASILAPPIGVAGQSFWIHCGTIGFERGGEKKEPSLKFEMQVFGENGRALSKPIAPNDADVRGDIAVSEFWLPVNRAGKFTVKLKATDLVAKKTAELSFPITVYDSK
jgi:hypothetical protein